LIVPLYIIPDGFSLNYGGMVPVYPGTSFADRQGASGTQKKDWGPIKVGKVNGQIGVQEANHVVEKHRHGLSGSFGVSVSHLHGNLLVRAQDNLRTATPMVDNRIE
jgi:hypothetical protein